MQANLGGSPTRLDWTKAFLRVREKDRGPLDFDVPGGAETTWQRVYICLRSGFDTEALEVLTPRCSDGYVWFQNASYSAIKFLCESGAIWWCPLWHGKLT